MAGGYRNLLGSGGQPEPTQPQATLVHHEGNPVFEQLQAQKAKVENALAGMNPLDPGYAHVEHSYNQLVNTIGKINYAHQHGQRLNNRTKLQREGQTILSEPSVDQMEKGESR